MLPAGYRIGLTVQGKDFERETEGARIESFLSPFRGSGPFIHTIAADRPGEIFGGENAVYGGGTKSSYLLLPIIPR